MIPRFTTFGSCSSRDIFFSEINPGYKDYFNIGAYSQTSTLISLMSNPTDFDEESINLTESATVNRIKSDFDKTFLSTLKQKKFDYLLLDTYYDIISGVLKLSNGNFVTNSFGLSDTDFYKELVDFKILKFQDSNLKSYSKEYFKEFKFACNNFFKFMKNESPQTKIILNLSKFTYKYYSKGSIQLKNDFLNIYKLNVYKDKLDAFILKNFDVDLIYFDTSIIGDENHVWGLHPTHYEPKYYKSATTQLREIISR